VGCPTGTTDVGVRPDVLLSGQYSHATEVTQLLPGQLLQRVWYVVVTHGHQPDCRVPGAGSVAPVRRRFEHDRPATASFQVPTSTAFI